MTKAPLQLFVGALVLTVLALEFFFDIGTDALWRQIVTGIDITLVVGFAIYLIKKIVANKNRLATFWEAEKVDIFLFTVVLFLLSLPRLAATIIIIRLCINYLSLFLDTSLGQKVLHLANWRPSQTLALSFLAAILVGSFLLTFPAATQDGKGARFVDAIFMMTSALCVTGLSVVDVGTYFSGFGQVIILLGIQMGGLGIMVLSASFAVLVGGHLPMRRQRGLSEMLDIRTVDGVKHLLRSIAGITFTLEIIGACFLFFLWSKDIPNIPERLWASIFHAVSAFCNCGLGLFSNSLESYMKAPLLIAVFMSLITMGGLGFFVITDLLSGKVWEIFKPKAIWDRLHIQSKVVLTASLALNLIGMLLFLFLEYDGILSNLSIMEKINASIFQAISLRTAGFTVVSQEFLSLPAVIFCLLWMFIGASPGSTGGGIKTTTASIALMTVRSMLRGRDDVEIFNRQVPPATVARSLSIVLIAAMVIFCFLMVLSATETLSLEKLLFETFSAFGTVGLSMGATTNLSDTGRFLVSMLMFVGRIGPLTLALAIGERPLSKSYHLPKGRIAVG